MSGDGNTLLTYALVTNPAPLQVSPSAGEASVATLTVVVSCPKSTGSATISQIMIVLPVGKPDAPDPTDLTGAAPPLSAASISSSGSDTWTPRIRQVPNVFVFTPQGGPVNVSDQSLTISTRDRGQPAGRYRDHPHQRMGGAAQGYSALAAVAAVRHDLAAGREIPLRILRGELHRRYAGNRARADGDAIVDRIDQRALPHEIRRAGATTSASVRAWTSPPLYDDTAFILEASSSQGSHPVKPRS